MAKALSNAGIEVLLGGIQTPKEIVRTALQEDADVIGYRLMHASPKVVIPILFEEMEKKGLREVPVVVGGIVPEKDEKLIREMGVKDVFHPYDQLDTLQERIKTIVLEARQTRKEAEPEQEGVAQI